jgi:hypothetical protein
MVAIMGQIIGPHSASIDSILASQIMSLRYNINIRSSLSPSLHHHLPNDDDE